MATKGDLVLLTGATGFLGFRTLRFLLEGGYNVRAAVRSESKADKLRSNPVLQALKQNDHLTFVVIPDFNAPHAFHEAAKGVQAIVHVASPIAMKATADFDATLIQPAIQGTLAILEAAQANPSVKRVIITSSVVASTPFSALWESSSGKLYTPESREVELEPPYDNEMVAYTASKIAALNRGEAWVKQHRPAFGVTHIHPSIILGRDDLLTNTAEVQGGTGSLALNIILANADAAPANPLPNSAIHVDDCARAHVEALDPKVATNTSYILSSPETDSVDWEKLTELVARRFPKEVDAGILPNAGKVSNVRVNYDLNKTVKTFGYKKSSFEDMIVPVVEQYVELFKKENA